MSYNPHNQWPCVILTSFSISLNSQCFSRNYGNVNATIEVLMECQGNEKFE